MYRRRARDKKAAAAASGSVLNVSWRELSTGTDCPTAYRVAARDGLLMESLLENLPAGSILGPLSADIYFSDPRVNERPRLAV